jgi:aryl-alcohol dehydrogenase-like predicted oxidoreductase
MRAAAHSRSSKVGAATLTLKGYASRGTVRAEPDRPRREQNARAPTGEWLGIRGDPNYVRQACDASLERLGVDPIDLYYQLGTGEGVRAFMCRTECRHR